MRLTFLLILIGLQLFDLPAWSQSPSEKLDRLLERIESTESYLQDLKITPNIQSQEQNPINEQVSKPVPALESLPIFQSRIKGPFHLRVYTTNSLIALNLPNPKFRP